MWIESLVHAVEVVAMATVAWLPAAVLLSLLLGGRCSHMALQHNIGQLETSEVVGLRQLPHKALAAAIKAEEPCNETNQRLHLPTATVGISQHAWVTTALILSCFTDDTQELGYVSFKHVCRNSEHLSVTLLVDLEH